jgi:hypothetical protein
MTEIPGPRRREEIRRCAEVIAPFGAMRAFRPPQGAQSPASRLDVQRGGHDCIGWSDHIEDWLPLTAEVLAARLEGTLRPGAVVLLHDAIWDPVEPGADDRDALLEAVDQTLGRRSGDFGFVTLPELFDAGRVRRRPWVTA